MLWHFCHRVPGAPPPPRAPLPRCSITCPFYLHSVGGDPQHSLLSGVGFPGFIHSLTGPEGGS